VRHTNISWARIAKPWGSKKFYFWSGMMNESTGKTTQSNESQTGNSGASNVYVPPASKEPFLLINVPEGADTDVIVKAVAKALETIEPPFFKLDSPLVAQARAQHRGDIYGRSATLAPGEALMMLVRQEGW
jgi:hypothetical protein